MATKKLYGATFGPYLYDDGDAIVDPDGDFSGMTWDASVSDGLHVCAGARFLDTNQSNHLTLTWGENDTADRTFQFLVGGGNRSFTLNENFTIGDGFAGTLTFGSACTLTVELTSILNQDLTTDASPTFASLSLGTGELTAGSINRASGSLTLEIGGVAQVTVTTTSITLAQAVVLTVGQIGFPAEQNASANANTLDDYEEGTWTFDLRFGGAKVGITYNASYATGYYVKIGRLVVCTGLMVLTSKGSSVGDAYIYGLPFTLANNPAAYSSCNLYFNAISFADAFMGNIEINSNYITMQEITNAGVATTLTDANFADNSQISFNLAYFV